MKIARKQIDEALLAERLGLDDLWLDQDNPELPQALPPYLFQMYNPAELEDLEDSLDTLVTAGCRRPVLYFCLAQLSPEAQEIRAGRQWATPAGTDDEGAFVRKQIRPLGTREDLRAASRAARSTRDIIRRYQRELLLAADTTLFPLPAGVLGSPENAEDALSLLESSLTWVRRIAEAYTAPMERTLLKSKGLLYLIAYVSVHATHVRSPQHRAERETFAVERSDKRAARHIPARDNALSSVATFVTGKDGGWSPSELAGKLAKFRNDHPRLYTTLTAKLRDLHEFASRS